MKLTLQEISDMTQLLFKYGDFPEKYALPLIDLHCWANNEIKKARLAKYDEEMARIEAEVKAQSGLVNPEDVPF